MICIKDADDGTYVWPVASRSANPVASWATEREHRIQQILFGLVAFMARHISRRGPRYSDGEWRRSIPQVSFSPREILDDLLQRGL
jgi:hypothetical protein